MISAFPLTALVVSVMTHLSLYRYLIWTFAVRKTRHCYVLDNKSGDEEINSDVCQLGTRNVVSPCVRACVCVCVRAHVCARVCVRMCARVCVRMCVWFQLWRMYSVYLYMRDCPWERQARKTVKDKWCCLQTWAQLVKLFHSYRQCFTGRIRRKMFHLHDDSEMIL